VAYTGHLMSTVDPVRAVKAYRGSGCIAPPPFNFDILHSLTGTQRRSGPFGERKILGTEPRTLQAVILSAWWRKTTVSVRMRQGATLMQCCHPYQ
jgi:hypothetical protein